MKPIRTFIKVCLSAACAATLMAAASAAAVAAPGLSMTTLVPDHVTQGRFMYTVVSVQNTGTDPLDGNLTFRYELPPGIPPSDPEVESSNMSLQCQTVGQAYECTGDATGIEPGVQIRLIAPTVVDANASGTLTGSITVSGGGAPEVLTDPFSIVVGPSGPFAIKAFDVSMSAAPTVPASRAGSAPKELRTEVSLLSEAETNLDFPDPSLMITSPTESFRDVIAHVPAGLVGNPTATPVRCTPSQLTTQSPQFQISTCPPESQVGLVQINAGPLVPLYNIEPPPGSPAAFGFFYSSVIVTLKAKIRPSDNGIDLVTEKSPSSIPIPKFEVTLWGVPSDPSHDRLRAFCLSGGYGYNASAGDCSLRTRSDVPFLRTPTSCPGTPLLWGIDIDTYQNVGGWVHSETTTPAMEGCQYNPFDPGFSLVPSTQAPHAPSGVDVAVTMDQDWSVTGIAPADVRRVSTTLPEGLSINPSSADGLQACTDAQLGLRQDGAATCPDASKLGTVTLRTPLLDHEVGGSIFLRTQNSDDPMSGELFRIAVEIRSDRDGLAIKLPGSIRADAVTGRLTTVFDDLPQLPFEAMTLHFSQGPRAPLASPSRCGTHTTSVDLLSWGDAPRHIETSFTTTGCKPPRFEPTFDAGIENPVAGGSSPFVVTLDRSDDDQELRSLTVQTPKGLLGRIKDADQCANGAADAGTCPPRSLIGHATVGAGVGSNPFFLDTGRVYLTGPYKGGPYGLAVVVDAIAGPFDLGRVVVRSAIHIDRKTAQLSVVSDPFPTIVKGVPLRIRSVRVAIDKPGFIVAPTSCTEKAVEAEVRSTDGRTADVSSRFRVGDCAELAFTPRLGLRLTGRKQTRSGKHPGVRAVVRQAKGQANIGRAAVTLPGSLALDPANAEALCEYDDAIKSDLENHCPKGSVVGRARARTPLLERPLVGDVYFMKNVRVDKRTGNRIRTTPAIVVALRGEIAINLKGTSSTDRSGRLVTTFKGVPDAPISRFDLNINGGDNGILLVTENARGNINICNRRQTANTRMTGQNGKRANFRVKVKTPCANRKR